MSDIKNCKGGACLSPANDEKNNSKKSTETSSKAGPIETDTTLSGTNFNK